jgi:hypothetical protein
MKQAKICRLICPLIGGISFLFLLPLLGTTTSSTWLDPGAVKTIILYIIGQSSLTGAQKTARN